MVSADNLNLDVLELIFAYLSGNDLASVANVSRSFLAGVIPTLYHTLNFRLCHAKLYPSVMSPFAVIVAKPGLAVHVREIDIFFAPPLKAFPHPQFIRECIQTLKLCANLWILKCTTNIVPSLLLSMQHKPRLRVLRANANLTRDQALILTTLTGLRVLTLEYASWSVVDLLPQWISSNSRTLKSLTVHNSVHLSEAVLKSALLHVPNLLGLHIIGCPKLDHLAVLRLTAHTTGLESLSLTTSECSANLPNQVNRLYHLRHLSLDTKFTLLPSPSPVILSSILHYLLLSSPPLKSVSLRLNDGSIQVGEQFVKMLMSTYARTLTNLAFINCAVPTNLVSLICKHAVALERLEVAVPVKESLRFTKALSSSSTLHTLVDLGEVHVTHGPRPNLDQFCIERMMEQVKKLRTVYSDNRIWTGEDVGGLGVLVHLQRFRGLPSEPWFTRLNSEL